MTNRKKNIFLIQLTIFLVAATLIYNTYRDEKKETENFLKIEAETDPGTNSFNDIEYSGFDLTG